MNAKRSESPASNRMFHTIVLMGSGLALSCGGVAKIEPGGDSEVAGASNTAVSGGSSNASGGSGNSIAGASALGGNVGIGGTGVIIIGPGGAGGSAASAGAAGAPVMPNCPFSQWDCTNSTTAGYCNYNGVYGLEIGSDCFCNSNRPQSAKDCASGFTFTCLDGVQSGATTDTPFQCTCAPTPTDGYLCEACGSGYDADYSCQNQTAPEPVLCGCAIVVLK
jgi:hypothetical protein